MRDGLGIPVTNEVGRRKGRKDERRPGSAGLRILGGVGVGFLLLTALTPLPNLISYWMAPGYPLGRAGAIVVLATGGVTGQGQLTDSSLRKLMDGIELYHEGWAPFLLLSGSPFGMGRREADARADLARSCGIPTGVVLTLSSARTTRDEAIQAWSLLAPRGIRSIILVTDTVAMARSMATFQKIGFDVIPSYGVPVLDLGGGPGARLGLMRRMILEGAAQGYYRLAGYL